MPTPEFPETLTLLRDALKAQPTLVDLVGQRIYITRPADPDWPLIQLTMVDEQELEWHTLFARVQCDIWGLDSSDVSIRNVRAVGRRLISVSRDLIGTYPSGTLNLVTPGIMVPSPDPDTGKARTYVDLRLEIQP